MPVQKILYTDTLRQGTDKINAIIDLANDAIVDVNEAVTVSNEALETANEALANSESTQAQLDAAILAGDSSPLAGQLKVGADGTVHSSAQVRFTTEFNSQQDIIDETKGKFTNRDSQVNSLGVFFNRLRNTTDNLTIACLGDSLTYGYDVSSPDRRPADTTPADDGSIETHERAGKTYPEQLQECFDIAYPGRVTVRNMGFSGDTTQLAFDRWDASNADLIIIQFGTNDRLGSVDTFMEYYRKLIHRELKNGTGVVISLPPKRALQNDAPLAVFRSIALQLAKEQNIIFIDMGRELSNIRKSFYATGDGTHFNTKGYSFLGAKMFAALEGESLANPVQVSHGFLSIRNQLDGFHALNAVSVGTAVNAFPTVDEVTENVGLVASLPAGAQCLYTFQTTSDNVVCIPELFVNGGVAYKLELKLNFGLEGQALSNSFMVGVNQTGYQPSTVVEFNEQDLNYARTKTTQYKTEDVLHISGLTSISDRMLLIPKAGFHTILITNTGTQTVTFDGLNFAPFETVRGIILGNTPRYHKFFTHTTSTGTDSVTESRVKVTDLIRKLKMDIASSVYYDTLPLKITVRNHDKNVLVYYAQLGMINNADTHTALLKNKDTGLIGDEYIYGTYSGSTHRTLASLHLDGTTDTGELVFVWGGSLTNPSSVTIQLA